MTAKIYLDTSVFSAYYDKRTPERLMLTQNSWKTIEKYIRFCSALTIEEIENSEDKKLQGKLMLLTKEFKTLEIADAVKDLADSYVKFGVMPRKYIKDAIHIAVASVNEIDVLLSWNFRHIVKRKTKNLVNLVNSIQGYKPLEILAPPEL